MNLVANLYNFTDWKKDNFDFVRFIINWLKKIVHYKLLKTFINIYKLAKIIKHIVR